MATPPTSSIERSKTKTTSSSSSAPRRSSSSNSSSHKGRSKSSSKQLQQQQQLHQQQQQQLHQLQQQHQQHQQQQQQQPMKQLHSRPPTPLPPLLSPKVQQRQRQQQRQQMIQKANEQLQQHQSQPPTTPTTKSRKVVKKKKVRKSSSSSSSSRVATTSKSTTSSHYSHIVLAVLFLLGPIVAVLFRLQSQCGVPPMGCADDVAAGEVVQGGPKKPRPSTLCRAVWYMQGWNYDGDHEGLECHEGKRSESRNGLGWNPFKMASSNVEKLLQSHHQGKNATTNNKRWVGGHRRPKGGDGSDRIDITRYANAYTVAPAIFSASQQDILREYSNRVQSTIPNMERRAASVPWGGGYYTHAASSTKFLQGKNSELLMASYLRIMKWPQNLFSHFPFKLCQRGCPSEWAISHTLEFREKFRPWLVSPSGMEENQGGYIYMRGYSRTPKRGDTSGHTMVWLRSGVRRPEDPLIYFRNIIHTLDRAVADNLSRSHGRVGKFNCVLDAAGYHLGMMPPYGALKGAVTILQDHFPDRLGMVFLANLSRPAQVLFNIMKPLITKEVRDKIVVLPHDPSKRLEVLKAVVVEEFIPDYLGGTDAYRFDAQQYYPRHHRCTESEAKAYTRTMPYHAI